MKTQKKTKFSWCPVCMVQTYHRRKHRGWECSSDDHQTFLRLRKDPWIEDYRNQIDLIRASLLQKSS